MQWILILLILVILLLIWRLSSIETKERMTRIYRTVGTANTGNDEQVAPGIINSLPLMDMTRTYNDGAGNRISCDECPNNFVCPECNQIMVKNVYDPLITPPILIPNETVSETFQPSANQRVMEWGVDSTGASLLDYRCPNKVCKLSTAFDIYAHKDDYDFWVNPNDSFAAKMVSKEIEPDFITSRQAMGACSGNTLSHSIFFDRNIDSLGTRNDDLLDGDRSLKSVKGGALSQSSVVELTRSTLGLSNPLPEGPKCMFIGSNGYKYKY